MKFIEIRSACSYLRHLHNTVVAHDDFVLSCSPCVPLKDIVLSAHSVQALGESGTGSIQDSVIDNEFKLVTNSQVDPDLPLR